MDVVVGAGGQTSGADGEDSTFGTITAHGGGGGSGENAAGRPGGSGGGSGIWTYEGPYNGGAAIPPEQGHNGGFGGYHDASQEGGGGGGAGGYTTGEGAGGVGLANDISGTSIVYAAGGAGRAYGTGAAGADGAVGLGEGGEGALTGYAGGKGSCGTVIIKWLTPRTVLDLDSEWFTHGPPRLWLHSGWVTFTPVWRLFLDSEWATHAPPRLRLDSNWKTDDFWMYAHDVFLISGRSQIAESSLQMHVRHDGFRLTCKEPPHLSDAYVGDLSAHGAFFTGSQARMNNVGDPAMPSYVTSTLRPSVFFNHSFALGIESLSYRAGILDVSIELSDHGGFIAATVVTAELGGGAAPAMYSPCVISCGGQTFRGRLEHREKNVGSVAGWTLTYAGPMTQLRDHRAFRRCYVTSDLDFWSTDQGPRSSPDTFEVISRSSGNTS
jgi:hypothetical protein